MAYRHRNPVGVVVERDAYEPCSSGLYGDRGQRYGEHTREVCCEAGVWRVYRVLGCTLQGVKVRELVGEAETEQEAERMVRCS